MVKSQVNATLYTQINAVFWHPTITQLIAFSLSPVDLWNLSQLTSSVKPTLATYEPNALAETHTCFLMRCVSTICQLHLHMIHKHKLSCKNIWIKVCEIPHACVFSFLILVGRFCVVYLWFTCAVTFVSNSLDWGLSLMLWCWWITGPVT